MIRFLSKKIIVFTKPFRYWLDGVTFRHGKRAEELRKLSGSLKGKPLLIVGNGPSLNKTPLDRFEGVYSIGMNKIDLLFSKTSWRPDIIVTTNNLVVHQHCRTMVENQIPCYLSWKSRWFVPRKIKHRFRFFLDKLTPDFESDISNGLGSSDTVTYVALQFAYYMEADPVIIVGVDHSFVQTGNPNEYDKREGDDVNHFDPNYFAAGQYWGVPNLQGSEVGYSKAKLAFDAVGRTILDATVDGKLQIFDKVSIDDAIRLVAKG
jgi:hypothetical protein